MRERMDYHDRDDVTYEEVEDNFLARFGYTIEELIGEGGLMERMAESAGELDEYFDSMIYKGTAILDGIEDDDTDYRGGDSGTNQEQGLVHHQEHFQTDDAGTAEHGDRYRKYRQRGRGKINGVYWSPPDIRHMPTLVFMEIPDPKRKSGERRQRPPGDTGREAYAPDEPGD